MLLNTSLMWTASPALVINVALTGRIGSGKSCVADAFRALGVPTLDLDAVGRTLQQQPQTVALLADTFGHHIVCDRRLDRAALAAICFADSQKMQQLEAIMHPLIWQQANPWSDQQQAPYGIIEASSLRTRNSTIAYIIRVHAPENIRHQRVIARGKQTTDDFMRINHLQAPPQGDFNIDNNKNLGALIQQVRTIHRELLMLI